MSSKKSISKRASKQLPAEIRKYTDDVPAKVLDTLSGSKSVAHVCVELGISKTTYYEWLKIYPEMKEAHDRARAGQEVFYMDTGVKAMFGEIENFNVNMYKFLAENVLGWNKNNQQVSGQNINIQNMQINNMSTADLETNVKQLLMKGGVIKDTDDGTTSKS